MTLPSRITTANATTVAMIGTTIGRNHATKSAIVLSISGCTEAPRSLDFELHHHSRIFIPCFSAAITFSSWRICADQITFPCCFCGVICSATSFGRKRFTGSGLVKTFWGVCSAVWLFSVQRKSNQNDNGGTRWPPAHMGTQGATTESPRSPVLRKVSADRIRLCRARTALRFPLLALLRHAGRERQGQIAGLQRTRLLRAATDAIGQFDLAVRTSGRLDLATNDLYHLRCFGELRGHHRKRSR